MFSHRVISTTMLRVDYDFKNADIYSFMRYVIQDFDDKKPGVQADSQVITLDFIKRFQAMPNLYTKIRMAYVDGKGDTMTTGGVIKADPSYNEFRFEVNYLF